MLAINPKYVYINKIRSVSDVKNHHVSVLKANYKNISEGHRHSADCSKFIALINCKCFLRSCEKVNNLFNIKLK